MHRLHRLAHKPMLQRIDVIAVHTRCLGIIELCGTTTECDYMVVQAVILLVEKLLHSY